MLLYKVNLEKLDTKSVSVGVGEWMKQCNQFNHYHILEKLEANIGIGSVGVCR